MKIAIIGAGIFGTTVAWMLAKNNYQVDLYEKREDIFTAASGINQYRLHRGYHYPRSKETILSCLYGEKEFIKIYPEAVLDEGIEHYYCLATEGSLITPAQCLAMWDQCNLEYSIEDLDIINTKNVRLSIKVKEFLFDPEKLKQVCHKKLKEYGVNLILNTEAKYSELKDKYDVIVLATYAVNNSLLEEFPNLQRDYQYEVCEKLTLKLPEKFHKKSVVIIDGPFMCIDPFGRTGYFAMGNVVHAIHSTNIGKSPIVPDEYKSVLNQGVVKNPPITHFKEFIETAERFFPGIKEAEHIGSMFTVRTVLPHREHDDARPTLVDQISDKVIALFSGKIPTCVDAANQVISFVHHKEKE